MSRADSTPRAAAWPSPSDISLAIAPERAAAAKPATRARSLLRNAWDVPAPPRPTNVSRELGVGRRRGFELLRQRQRHRGEPPGAGRRIPAADDPPIGERIEPSDEAFAVPDEDILGAAPGDPRKAAARLRLVIAERRWIEQRQPHGVGPGRQGAGRGGRGHGRKHGKHASGERGGAQLKAAASLARPLARPLDSGARPGGPSRQPDGDFLDNIGAPQPLTALGRISGRSGAATSFKWMTRGCAWSLARGVRQDGGSESAFAGRQTPGSLSYDGRREIVFVAAEAAP